MDTAPPIIDSLKILGGALAALAAQWIYGHAIPYLKTALSGPWKPPVQVPEPLPRANGSSGQSALILERLRSQEMEDTIEKARTANLDAYLREIRVLSEKVDSLAASRLTSVGELSRLTGRLRKAVDDLEGIRNSIFDALKGPA